MTNAVSGLRVTDGAAINLVDVNGDGSVIVGVVQAGTFDGQAAFAISINSGTGVVTVEQYLSLQQDSLATTPNDPVSLARELAGGDGDGDRRRRRQGERPDRRVGPDQLCRRRPGVTAVGSGVTAALDEGNTNSGSPPTSTPATINTGAIAKGDDPDVAGTGYISHAVSTGALVTPTLAFGADGPLGGTPTTGTSYALTVTNRGVGPACDRRCGDQPCRRQRRRQRDCRRRSGWHVRRPGGVCDLDQQRHGRGDGRAVSVAATGQPRHHAG